jgi:CTP synthase (UTP-ammonia lyase)
VKSQVSIAIVGDYDPKREYHQATNDALEHAGTALGVAVLGDWIPTDLLDFDDPATRLARYDAVFLAPGAPYRSSVGAFAAIGFARKQGWPFFGT